MKRNDLIPALIIALFGAVVAVVSYILGLGSLRVPGPGMAPFLIGTLLVLSSLPVVVSAFLAAPAGSIGSGTSPWHGINLRKIGLCLLTLLGFGVIFRICRFCSVGVALPDLPFPNSRKAKVENYIAGFFFDGAGFLRFVRGDTRS